MGAKLAELRHYASTDSKKNKNTRHATNKVTCAFGDIDPPQKCESSIGTAGTFERTVGSRRTGVAIVFGVLSIRMWSFDVFAISKDLELRLAG
jgi:hypothetical protein